jgi:hypothetical protein
VSGLAPGTSAASQCEPLLRHGQRKDRQQLSQLIEGDAGHRRRTKVTGQLPGETSRLTLVWAVLDRTSRNWRGLAMTSDGLRLLQDLRRIGYLMNDRHRGR